MSDPTEEMAVLRDRVERQEAELGAAVRELAGAARRSVGPSHWIRESPLLWIVGAVACGFWLGRRSRRERNRR